MMWRFWGRAIPCAWGLMTCLVAVPAWAGWMATFEAMHPDGGKGRFFQYYDHGRYAEDMGRSVTVIADGQISYIDTVAKAYWQGTPARFCREQQKMMEEIDALLPAEYREKPISQRRVTRKKVGAATIAGFRATGYRFFVDGKQETEIWVSSDSGLSGLIAAQRESVGRALDCDRGSSSSVSDSKLYRRTVRDAFVLKYPSGRVGEQILWNSLVSVEKQRVSDTKFRVPSGYRKFTDLQKFYKYSGSFQDTDQNKPRRASAGHRPPFTLPDPGPSSRSGARRPSSEREEPATAAEDEAGDNSGIPGMDKLKKGLGDMLKSIW